MEIAYLHVVINHLPIMGVPIGLGLLLLGLWTRSEAIKRAALLTLVVLGLLTVPVFLTGKSGEDFVEHAGLSEEAIEQHEEMATIAFVSVELLAALSLFLFLRYGGLSVLGRGGDAAPQGSAVPASAAVMVLVLGAATAAMLGYTGKLGGKISHTEFYSGPQAADAEAEDERGKHRGRGED